MLRKQKSRKINYNVYSTLSNLPDILQYINLKGQQPGWRYTSKFEHQLHSVRSSRSWICSSESACVGSANLVLKATISWLPSLPYRFPCVHCSANRTRGSILVLRSETRRLASFLCIYSSTVYYHTLFLSKINLRGVFRITLPGTDSILSTTLFTIIGHFSPAFLNRNSPLFPNLLQYQILLPRRFVGSISMACAA